MPDDINFLPEKTREQKEREQVKKKIQQRVEFHTPQLEQLAEKSALNPVSAAVGSALGRTLAAIKKFFAFRRPAGAPQPASREPVRLFRKSSAPASTQPLLRESSGPQATGRPAVPEGAPAANLAEELASDYNQVDVNLMPWIDPRIELNRKLRLVVIIVSFLVIVVWGTVLRIANTQKSSRVADLEASIQVLDIQLQNINSELLAQGSLVAVRQQEFLSLYASLPDWSKFFTWLERMTHEQVYFDNLTAAADSISLEARAPDFQIAASQWLAFTSATSWVEQAQVSGLKTEKDEAGAESVSFSLDISFKPGALLRGDRFE